jgi:DNA-binding response OmpR family regulator
MPRPALIVAEPEPPESLSTRKLVLETAKFNVITAHSTQEAIDTFNLFPNASAAVLVAGMEIDCAKVVNAIRDADPPGSLPIIALSPRIGFACEGADYILPSREPHALLELIRNLFGDPRKL